MPSNKQRAIWTWHRIKERQDAREKQADNDFLAHISENVDKKYKRNYPGMKRRGQI